MAPPEGADDPPRPTLLGQVCLHHIWFLRCRPHVLGSRFQGHPRSIKADPETLAHPPEEVACVLLVRVVSQCPLPLLHSQWGNYPSDLCPQLWRQLLSRQLLSRQWSTCVEEGQIPHVGVPSPCDSPDSTGRSWWVRAGREYYR